LVVLSLFVAIVLVFLATNTKPVTTTKDNVIVVVTTKQNTPQILEELDTDGDGLKDWEEELWNTDPKNPDTDGDGVEDGIEISRLREDISSGDILAKRPDRGAETQSDLTPTDIFARDIFSTYISARGSNDALDSTQTTALAQSFFKNIPTYADSQTRYTSSAINLTSDNSDDALKDYSDTLKSIFAKYDSGLEHELSVLANLSQADLGKVDLSDLFVIANSYTLASQALLQVPAPSSLSDMHLEMINVLGAIAEELRALALLYEDPLNAITALSLYSDDSTTLTETIREIQSRFSNRGLIFLN